MRLTFKNEYPTGQYRSFSHISCTIKANGDAVGSIMWSANRNSYAVMLHVKIPTTDNCPFRNVTLKKEFPHTTERETLNAAKEWVKANWDSLQKVWPLHKT